MVSDVSAVPYDGISSFPGSVPPVQSPGQRAVQLTAIGVIVVGPFIGLVAAVYLLWGHGIGLAHVLLAAFFYLLTGVHGLHLVGGVVACARAVGQLGLRGEEQRAARNIALCAVYWHFLLLVCQVIVLRFLQFYPYTRLTQEFDQSTVLRQSTVGTHQS